MKQTSVEWLIEQVNSENYQKAFGQTYISVALIEQAKEMEKDQIENACDKFANSIDFKIEDFEQYYNETYGKGNS